MAVTPRPSRWCAAAWPPSTANSEWETSVAASSAGMPASRFIASMNAARLRTTGTKRIGPTARPMRRWPIDAKVRDRQLHGCGVVVGDERGVDALRVAVHQDDRQPALDERGIALVVGRAVGVQARHEDDPRDAAVEEQLDVLVLGDAPWRLGAQHRREAALSEERLHDLGERREDRVLELRHDQPDQSRPAAQPQRTLVAQHVQSREHRLTGGRRDAGPVVEHPRHGRLADARMLGDVGTAGPSGSRSRPSA